MAFPRLTAFSFWMYLAGGILLWVAFVLDIAPDVGWFDYPPLAGPQYRAGQRVDIWAQMITFTEVAGARGRGQHRRDDPEAARARA